MKDLWNLDYNWNLTDSTWLRTERLDLYWSGVTYIPDNYFKYKKCLSGITYQYVNTLNDIYNKNAMVGKTWCIYDMYNEFDIINNFMVNMDTVDICSTSNLDLTQRYYTIDNAYLKTKHKVLLVNQTDTTQNDLYNVDQRGYLIKSIQLADSGNTFRYKGYVKLGDNKHNEYHLKDIGGLFPTSGMPANYMLGRTSIIKHFFTYNINAVKPVPKLIFTDYDIARHLNPLNYSLYTGFLLPTPSSNVVIKYRDNDNYTINIDSTTSDFIYNGIISGSTIYNGIYASPGGNSEQFFIETNNVNFLTNANINDYVKVTFSGNTNLEYYTYIKFNDGYCPANSIALFDPIPLNLLNDFYASGGTYTITNLQYSTAANIQTTLLESYYSKYFYVDGSLNVSPKYYQYNDYFDYDGLQFIVDGGTPNIFTTTNTYIKYKLYEHLNSINSIFSLSYTFPNFPNQSLTSFTTGFTVLVTSPQSSEYYDRYPKGTYLKITPTNPVDIYFFRKNTFVNLNGSYKTLIVDYVPNEYFIIETYKSDSGLTISNIDTIYTLTGISSLLYSVYKNDGNDWYRERPDNIRKMICNAYSRIIENDANITKYTTGLLTQDDKNKFILELYNPENLLNNGGNATFTYDPNLTYKPIELIDIGVDKHTKIPIPIQSENMQITYDLLTGVTSGSTTGTTSYDTFSFGEKRITFIYSLQSSTNPTNLTISWGDGNVESITIPAYGIFNGTHTYAIEDFHTITFSGDLQYITYLFAEGAIVSINTNITKLKNITNINLNNNSLIDLDISGLIYLQHLYLYNNALTDSDKFYNLLDSNGLTSGNIDTSGGGNSPVTLASVASRATLSLKGWTLTYN